MLNFRCHFNRLCRNENNPAPTLDRARVGPVYPIEFSGPPPSRPEPQKDIAQGVAGRIAENGLNGRGGFVQDGSMSSGRPTLRNIESIKVHEKDLRIARLFEGQ